MRLLIAFWMVSWHTILFAQERLTELSENPYLPKNQLSGIQKNAIKSALPFFDDFSVVSGFPNQQKWIDNNVFINANYPVNPPSIGVATFDAVDSKGVIHSWLTETSQSSDTLTSVKIDLSGADQASTYLSFYYQPQGNAIRWPGFNDSIILNVLANGNSYKIWYANGSKFKTFKNDTLGIDDDRPDTLEFKLVNLKLDKPEFFTDDFQIQFVGYASLSQGYGGSGWTNTDFWHIDYVYLNDDRSDADTVFTDVAMVEPTTGFMKDYTSIPWAHFNEGIYKELDDLYFHLRNNDEIIRNVTSSYLYITDISTGSYSDFYPGQRNLIPSTNSKSILWNFSKPPIQWYESESATFEIKGGFLTDEADPKANNEATQMVIYSNYYAYDDGTAEFAYGIDPQGETGKVAMKYNTYVGDTLRGVQVYFAQPKSIESALQSFSLCVWEVYNKQPGNVIIKESGKKPIFTDELNQFATILLDTAIYIEGEFFIGWEQSTSPLINIGLDANSVRRDSILFYYLNSDWYKSDIEGSLLFRPIFSSSKITTEITTKIQDDIINIWPNPVSGQMYIDAVTNDRAYQVKIFNTLGKMVWMGMVNNTEPISVSHLPTGMYIVNLSTDNKVIGAKRIVIKN